MKKFLLIAASAMIALASCTNDESAPEQREISFKSYAQKSSKAGSYGPMTTSTYEVNEHFGVYAFLNTGTVSDPVWADNNFMNNVEIQRTGSDPDFVWKNATTTYYWPNIGSLTFACYSPYGFMQDGTTNTTVVSANKVNGISFTGFTAPTANDKQIDLMVADLKKNQIYDVATYDGAVNVVFNHILSQIKFTAATMVNVQVNTNVKGIAINHIKVHSLKTVGKYSSTDGTATNGTWPVEHLGNPQTYEISSVTVPLTTEPVNNSLLVIPQDATGYNWDDNGASNDKIFEVKYTITFSENNIDIPIVKTVCFKPTSKWEKGYIYTYNLQIGLNEITFAPEVVSEWTAGSSSDFD